MLDPQTNEHSHAYGQGGRPMPTTSDSRSPIDQGSAISGDRNS
jgi:hypothetical protein